MGIAKNGYYTTKDIDKYNCEWNIVYGERAPGKSFAIKRKALERAWKTKKPCLGLIRRQATDIETDQVESYFTDRNINVVSEVTGGEFTFISYWRKMMYFARIENDENSPRYGKVIRGSAVGKVFAVSTAKHWKSTGHPFIDFIIYEEFISEDGYYEKNEPFKLENLISTIMRKDDNCKIYLIGNALSRVCPYFLEWGLKNIRKQKQGTIDIYEHENTEGEIIKIAVEHCPPSPIKSKLFFGRAAKSIQGGAWYTESYPHLPDDYEAYEECYAITYHSRDDFWFTLRILCHKEEGYIITFIHPAKHKCERIISSAFSTNILVTPQLDRTNPAEALIHDCFINNKVVYSDNQSAQDFCDSIKAELHNPFI